MTHEVVKFIILGSRLRLSKNNFAFTRFHKRAIDVDGRRDNSSRDFLKLCQSVPDRVSCNLEDSQSSAVLSRCFCHEVI